MLPKVCIYRSATYDFLLTFHSNHGPISYRFRDKRWFQSKITNFLTTTVHSAPPLKGFPLELGTGAGGQKLEWWAMGRERSLTISSVVSIQYTNAWQTDGQMVGRMDTGRQLRSRLHIASCGKNSCLLYQKSESPHTQSKCEGVPTPYALKLLFINYDCTGQKKPNSKPTADCDLYFSSCDFHT